MDEIKKIQLCRQVHEKARQMRGKLINSTSCIEHDLSILLTEYFWIKDNNKRKLFYEVIISKLPLRRKKDILIAILKEDYPTYYKEWKEEEQFTTNFDQVIQFRNKMAHSVIDVSENALLRPLMDGVGFIQYNDGAPITDDDFNDFEVKANMVLSTLSTIKRLLPYKKSNNL